MSYLVLVGLFSYFLMVELRPYTPSVIEIIVWVWSLTLFIELVRQVCSSMVLLYKSQLHALIDNSVCMSESAPKVRALLILSNHTTKQSSRKTLVTQIAR